MEEKTINIGRYKYRLIQVGRPVHMRVKSNASHETACGLIGSSGKLSAWDARDVECGLCRKTKAYKKAMGIK